MRLSPAVLAVLGVLLGACAAQHKDLERKVDEVARAQRDTAELSHKVDALTAELAALREHDQQLEHQLDQLASAAANRRPAPARPTMRPEPDRAKTYAIPIDGDPFVGPGDAKVTLVLMYDYADPYTEKSRETLDALRKQYGKDLRIVYKPFIVHPQVATAAALAICAAEKQHKFVELDALLWEKGFKGRHFDQSDVAGASPPQKCWNAPTGCPIVLGFAKDLHLDIGKLKVEMQNCEPWVSRQMTDVAPFSVGATPTFYINGRNLVGAMPIDNFTPVIDEELKLANQRIAGGSKQARYYEEWILGKGLKALEP